MMKIIKVNEYEINAELEESILNLLIECFPETYPKNRIYYKQMPHFRYLVFDHDILISQVGLDYRVMNLNGNTVKILGIIDLCTKQKYSGKGIASNLLNQIEEFARRNNIDFLLLFADNENLYSRNGFNRVDNICTWLKINEHKTLGIGEEVITELMTKKVGNRNWENGNLDMLGYLY